MRSRLSVAIQASAAGDRQVPPLPHHISSPSRPCRLSCFFKITTHSATTRSIDLCDYVSNSAHVSSSAEDKPCLSFQSPKFAGLEKSMLDVSAYRDADLRRPARIKSHIVAEKCRSNILRKLYLTMILYHWSISGFRLHVLVRAFESRARSRRHAIRSHRI